MKWPGDRQPARAAILTVACTLMVSGGVIDGHARAVEPGATQAKPSESPPFRVTIEEPSGRDHRPLTLVRRARLRGLVRVERTGKVEPQETIVLSFIREHDKALAGQFNAARKQVGPNTYEYEVEIIAPPSVAKYDLVTTLNRTNVPGPKPGASIKLEVK